MYRSLEDIFSTMVDVKTKKNSVERVMFGQVVRLIEKESASLYKCYSGNLTKEQKMAIRSSYRGLPVHYSDQLFRLYKELIECGSKPTGLSEQNLRWQLALLKHEGSEYCMPTDAARYKISGYGKDRNGYNDLELIGASLYQLLNNQLSCATTISIAGDTGVHSDSCLFRVNDIGVLSFTEWVKFFVSCPGYDAWKTEVLSRKGVPTVKFHIPKAGDHCYYISSGYFK